MNILVYNGEGVADVACPELFRSLKDCSMGQAVRYAGPEYFDAPDWEFSTAALAMPGGRDLLYMKHLVGERIKRIQTFVSAGGIYLGFCGGAYFGCSSIAFDFGGALEVTGERDLKFFPGKGIGPVFGTGTFRYESEWGARPVRLSLADSIGWGEIQECTAYHNGSCYFEDADQYSNVEILARYSEIPGNPAAIILCRVGRGSALLSGTHIEYSAATIAGKDPYYLDPEKIEPYEEDEPVRREVFRRLIEKAMEK